MTIPAYLVQPEPPRLHSAEPTTSNLPNASKCRLEYLNEGGANFVFKILPEHGLGLPPVFHGKLLRLRKDDPHIPNAEDQLRALKENFQDLFSPTNLLEQSIILLDASILSALNEYIRRVERPLRRQGDCMAMASMSGLLVTDMTRKEEESCLQLKPKWLVQSPDAPSHSKRCRTCALRAYRASERISTATDAQETCPLALVSMQLDDRTQAVRAITSDWMIRDYLLDQAHVLLRQLQTSQMKFDPHGVLKISGDIPVKDLCKAMTLRDCTLFVKRSGRSIEARLGDLDLKQPEKLPRWKAIESTLIKEGWYTNTESGDVRTREQICLLSRCQP